MRARLRARVTGRVASLGRGRASRRRSRGRVAGEVGGLWVAGRNDALAAALATRVASSPVLSSSPPRPGVLLSARPEDRGCRHPRLAARTRGSASTSCAIAVHSCELDGPQGLVAGRGRIGSEWRSRRRAGHLCRVILHPLLAARSHGGSSSAYPAADSLAGARPNRARDQDHVDGTVPSSGIL